MKSIWLLVPLLLFLPVRAEAGGGTFWTGQTFIAALNEGGAKHTMANGYAIAVLDMAEALNHVCAPDGVTIGQVTAVAQKYLEAHPEHWDWPAAALIENSYLAVWACPKKA